MKICSAAGVQAEKKRTSPGYNRISRTLHSKLLLPITDVIFVLLAKFNLEPFVPGTVEMKIQLLSSVFGWWEFIDLAL